MIIVLIIYCTNISATIIRDDLIWNYNISGSIAHNGAEYDKCNFSMKFDGTDVINQTTYHKLVTTGGNLYKWTGKATFAPSSQFEGEQCYYMRENEGILYVYDEYLNRDRVIFNYNVGIGNNFTIEGHFCSEYSAYVTSIDTMYTETDKFTKYTLQLSLKDFDSDVKFEQIFVDGIGYVSPGGCLAFLGENEIAGIFSGNAKYLPIPGYSDLRFSYVSDIYGNQIYPQVDYNNSYVSMVRDDRVWEYIGTSPDNSYIYLHKLKCQDTYEINNSVWHEILLYNTQVLLIDTLDNNSTKYTIIEDFPRNELMFYLLEENNNVYILTSEGQIVKDSLRNYEYDSLNKLLLFNWNIKGGDSILYPNNMSSNNTFDWEWSNFDITLGPSMQIDSQNCRVMKFSNSNVKVIEGIGPIVNGTIGEINLLESTNTNDTSLRPGNTSTLNRVYDSDNNIIFGKEDFIDVSIINDITNDRNFSGSKIYDIMGREVKQLLPGDIYIQNGKKFIGK